MAEPTPASGPIVCAGLTVSEEGAPSLASLRYFARDGEFARVLGEATGLALPEPLKVNARGDWILAWRSPTETVCLAGADERFAGLCARLAGAAGGCVVDLSGALEMLRLEGARVSDLLCRLGGTASVPLAGEARRSRLADVPVFALCVREGETLLLVDRAYAPHLLDWIRETVLDFIAPGPAAGS